MLLYAAATTRIKKKRDKGYPQPTQPRKRFPPPSASQTMYLIQKVLDGDLKQSPSKTTPKKKKHTSLSQAKRTAMIKARMREFNRMVNAQTHNQFIPGQPRQQQQQQQQLHYQNLGMNNTMPVPSAPPMSASSYVPQHMANTQPPHTMTGLNYGPMHPMQQSRANPRIIAANSAYTNAPRMMVPQQPYYPSRAYASTINNYTPPPSSSFPYTGALPYPYNTSGSSAAATQRANATAKAQQEMLRESERLRRTEQKLSQSRLEQLEIQRLQAETHRAAGM